MENSEQLENQYDDATAGRKSIVVRDEKPSNRMSMAAVTQLGNFGELRAQVSFQEQDLCRLELTDGNGALMFPTLQDLANNLVSVLKEDVSLKMKGEQGRIVDYLILLLRSTRPRVDVYGPVAKDCVGTQATTGEWERLSTNREYVAVLKMWNRVSHQRMASNARNACSKVAEMFPLIQPDMVIENDNDDSCSDSSISSSDSVGRSVRSRKSTSKTATFVMQSGHITSKLNLSQPGSQIAENNNAKTVNHLDANDEEDQTQTNGNQLSRSQLLRLFFILWKMLLNPTYQVHHVFGLEFVAAFVTFTRRFLPHLLSISVEQQFAFTGSFWALCYSPRSCEALITRLGNKTGSLIKDIMKVLRSFNSLTSGSVLPSGRNLLCAAFALSHTCYMIESERDEELEIHFAQTKEDFWHLLEDNNFQTNRKQTNQVNVRVGFYLKSAYYGHYLVRLLNHAKDSKVGFIAASMLCNFYSARRAILFAVHNHQKPAVDDSEKDEEQDNDKNASEANTKPKEPSGKCYSFLPAILRIISQQDVNIKNSSRDFGTILSLVLLIRNVAKYGGVSLLGPDVITDLSGTIQWAVRCSVMLRSSTVTSRKGIALGLQFSEASSEAFQVTSHVRAIERVIFLAVTAVCYCFHHYPTDLIAAISTRNQCETFLVAMCKLIQFCRDQKLLLSQSSKLPKETGEEGSVRTNETKKYSKVVQSIPVTLEEGINDKPNTTKSSSRSLGSSSSSDESQDGDDKSCCSSENNSDSEASSSSSSSDEGSSDSNDSDSESESKPELLRSKTFNGGSTKAVLVALEQLSLLTIRRSLALHSTRQHMLEILDDDKNDVVSETILSVDDCLSGGARQHQEACISALLYIDFNNTKILGIAPLPVHHVFDDASESSRDRNWSSTVDAMDNDHPEAKRNHQSNVPVNDEDHPNSNNEICLRGVRLARVAYENDTRFQTKQRCMVQLEHEKRLQLNLTKRLNHLTFIDSAAAEIQDRSNSGSLTSRIEREKQHSSVSDATQHEHSENNGVSDDSEFTSLVVKLSLPVQLFYHHPPHVSESSIQVMLVMLTSANPSTREGAATLLYVCEAFWALGRERKYRHRLVSAGILRCIMSVAIRALKSNPSVPDMLCTRELAGIDTSDQHHQNIDCKDRASNASGSDGHPPRPSLFTRHGQEANGFSTTSTKDSRMSGARSRQSFVSGNSVPFRGTSSIIWNEQQASTQRDSMQLRRSRSSFFKGAPSTGTKRRTNQSNNNLKTDETHMRYPESPDCMDTIHCIVTLIWLLAMEEKNLMAIRTQDVSSFVLAVLDELVLNNIEHIRNIVSRMATRPCWNSTTEMCLNACKKRLYLGVHCIKMFMAIAHFPTTGKDMATPPYFGKLFVIATSQFVNLSNLTTRDPMLLKELSVTLGASLRLQRVAAGAITRIPWHRDQVSDPAYVTIATSFCSYTSPKHKNSHFTNIHLECTLRLQELEHQTFGCHILTKAPLTKKGHALTRKVHFPSRLLDFAVAGVREHSDGLIREIESGIDVEVVHQKSKIFAQREDRRVQSLFALSTLCRDQDTVTLVCATGLYKVFLVSWASENPTVKRLCAILLRQMNAEHRNRSSIFKAELRARSTQQRNDIHKQGLEKAIQQFSKPIEVALFESYDGCVPVPEDVLVSDDSKDDECKRDESNVDTFNGGESNVKVCKGDECDSLDNVSVSSQIQFGQRNTLNRVHTLHSLGERSNGRIDEAALRSQFYEWLTEELDTVETRQDRQQRKRHSRRLRKERRAQAAKLKKEWAMAHELHVAPGGQGGLVVQHEQNNCNSERVLPRRFSTVAMHRESPLWENRMLLPIWRKEPATGSHPPTVGNSQFPLMHRMCKPLHTMWKFDHNLKETRSPWHPAVEISPVPSLSGNLTNRDYRMRVCDIGQTKIQSYLFREFIVNVPILPGRKRLNMWHAVPGSRVYEDSGVQKYTLPSHKHLLREIRQQQNHAALEEQHSIHTSIENHQLGSKPTCDKPDAKYSSSASQRAKMKRSKSKHKSMRNGEKPEKKVGELTQQEALHFVVEARRELERQSIAKSHKAGVDVSAKKSRPTIIGARKTLILASQVAAEERKKTQEELAQRKVQVSVVDPSETTEKHASNKQEIEQQNTTNSTKQVPISSTTTNGRRKGDFTLPSSHPTTPKLLTAEPPIESFEVEARRQVFLYYTGDSLGMLRARSCGILADLAASSDPTALAVVGGGLPEFHIPIWHTQNGGATFQPNVISDAIRQTKLAVGEDWFTDIEEHPLPFVPVDPPSEHLSGPRTDLWTESGDVADRPFPILVVERKEAAKPTSFERSPTDLLLSGLASKFQGDLSASRFQPWTLQTSVFADRPRLCDARSFWDDLGVHKKALRYDLGRMMSKPEFSNWFSELTSMEDEEKLLNLLDGGMYRLLANCFRYYSALGLPGDLFMGRNEFQLFANDAQLIDSINCKKNNLEVVVLSVMTSRLKHKFHKKQATHNPDAYVRFGKDKVLLRHEFLEAVFRIAELKYFEETGSLFGAIQMLWERCIQPSLETEVILDPDNFRNDRLYFKSVDQVLRDGMGVTKPLFEKWTGELRSEKYGGRKGRMTIREWNSMWKWMGLLGPNFTKREAQIAFKMSIMHVDDEVTNWGRSVTIDYVSFLEALGRVCELIVIPTTEQLQMLGADDIFEFYAIMSNCPHLWDAIEESGSEDNQSKLQIWKNPTSNIDSMSMGTENDVSFRTKRRLATNVEAHSYDSRPLAYKLNQIHILLAGFDSLASRVRNANLMFSAQKPSKRVPTAPSATSALGQQLGMDTSGTPTVTANVSSNIQSRTVTQPSSSAEKPDSSANSGLSGKAAARVGGSSRTTRSTRRERSPLQQSLAAPELNSSGVTGSVRRSTRVMRTFSRLQLDELTKTPEGDSFEVQVATALHEAWRQNRQRRDDGTVEPSEKLLHGKKYDITKLSFEQLPSLYKSENLLAAHAACESIRWAWQRFVNEVENIPDGFHKPTRPAFYKFLRSSDFVEAAAEIQHVQYCKRHQHYGMAVSDANEASSDSSQKQQQLMSGKAKKGIVKKGAVKQENEVSRRSHLELSFSDLPLEVKNKNRVVVETAVEVYIALDEVVVRENAVNVMFNGVGQ